jgi:hypothetical protein
MGDNKNLEIKNIQLSDKSENLLAVNRALGEVKNIAQCLTKMKRYYEKDQLDFDFFEMEQRVGNYAKELAKIIEDTETAVFTKQAEENQAKKDEYENELRANKPRGNIYLMQDFRPPSAPDQRRPMQNMIGASKAKPKSKTKSKSKKTKKKILADLSDEESD